MKRTIAVVLIGFSLTGCIRGYYYDMNTGLRGDNPAVSRKFTTAKTICEGERAKVLASSTVGLGLAADLSDRVMDACMIQHGFEVRPT